MPLNNLDDIRVALGKELRYAPDLEVQRIDDREVINRAYEKLARMRPWPWLLRRAPIYLFPDLTIANDEVIASAGYGPRTLQLSGTTLAGLGMFDVADAGSSELLHPYLCGAEFDLADRDLRGEGGSNWPEAPFVIEHVSVSSAPLRFQLDPRASLSLDPADGDYVIRFPRVRLPADVDQVVALRDADGVKLTPVPSGSETRWHRGQPAGRPVWLLEDPGHAPRFPPTVYPGLSASGASVNAGQSPFLYQRENLPVSKTISGAVVAGGDLAANVKVRAFVCWWYADRFGPPSNVVSVTTTDSNKTVRLSALPVLETSGAQIEYGRRLAVFAAEGESAFYLRGFVLTTDATFDIDEPISTPTAAIRPARYDEVFPGEYQYIRVHPRPTSMQQLELEYKGKPRQLIEATDRPEFERAYYDTILWLACLEASAKHADSSFFARCDKLAGESYARLNARYFPGDRYIVRNGLFSLESPMPLAGFIDADHLDYRGP